MKRVLNGKVSLSFLRKTSNTFERHQALENQLREFCPGSAKGKILQCSVAFFDDSKLACRNRFITQRQDVISDDCSEQRVRTAMNCATHHSRFDLHILIACHNFVSLSSIKCLNIAFDLETCSCVTSGPPYNGYMPAPYKSGTI
jgi:hypothetical protein